MYIKCIILSDLHNPSSLSSCISIWSTQPLLLVIMHFYLIYTTPPPCHHAFLSDLHNPSSLSSCISIWSTQPLLLVIMHFYLIYTTPPPCHHVLLSDLHWCLLFIPLFKTPFYNSGTSLNIHFSLCLNLFNDLPCYSFCHRWYPCHFLLLRRQW